MMNTLDLSVDHVFWELKQNPWVVRNLLDNFLRHYSYIDEVKRDRGEDSPRSPGGISFAHDMGVHNNFAPPGTSSYELKNLTGCFSYMTAEQLCNWSLLAATYVLKTGDLHWARLNQHVLTACVNSLVNRGGETGYVHYDSAHCEKGAEITTYDSLDNSLAQTRNNVYMAVKCWAGYLGLALVLEKLEAPIAQTARKEMEQIERDLQRRPDSEAFSRQSLKRTTPVINRGSCRRARAWFILSCGVSACPQFCRKRSRNTRRRYCWIPSDETCSPMAGSSSLPLQIIRG
jgi:hypothetical protein